MKLNRLISSLLIVIFATAVFSGCASKEKEASTSKGEKQVIKLGVTGSEHKLWDELKKKLEKENIDLQIISFNDYIKPNLALAEGEIDANAFQTIVYFDKFKEDRKLDLTSLGYTVLAPMAIYSKKIKDIKDLKDGGQVAVPNDATNLGRALILLQDAGFIKLKEGSGHTPTLKDIVENKKNLKIIELVATQIPRSIEDVDVAVINNGVAVDAGYSPLKDSIYLEDTKKESVKNYFNIIAVRTKDKDSEKLKKLIQVYQTEETKKLINDIYKGASLPAF